MISRYWLSFLIFFNSSFCFAITDNEVLQRYKTENGAYRYDFYRHVNENSKNYNMNWQDFENYIATTEEYHKTEGIAYIVSGLAIAIAASFGYSNANSSTEKVAYSLAQSLSIGAIGYGTYKYYIGNNDRSFYHVVSRTESLSIESKNQLILNYNLEKKWQKQQINWISLGTYALIAITNYLNAAKEKDKGTRDTLYVIGGVYTLAAISVTF